VYEILSSDLPLNFDTEQVDITAGKARLIYFPNLRNFICNKSFYRNKLIDRLKGGVYLCGSEKLIHSYSAIMILGYS